MKSLQLASKNLRKLERRVAPLLLGLGDVASEGHVYELISAKLPVGPQKRSGAEDAAEAPIGRRILMADSSDDVFYSRLHRLERNAKSVYRAFKCPWSCEDFAKEESVGLRKLAAVLARFPASGPLFALSSGWGDAGGAAYDGVLVVDEQTQEVLWIALVREGSEV